MKNVIQFPENPVPLEGSSIFSFKQSSCVDAGSVLWSFLTEEDTKEALAVSKALHYNSTLN